MVVVIVIVIAQITTKVISIAEDKTKKPVKQAASKTGGTKADLVAENKKLLKEKPKGFMDKIKANVAKIKALAKGAGSAPTTNMARGKEPASREGQRAKENINKAGIVKPKGWEICQGLRNRIWGKPVELSS